MNSIDLSPLYRSSIGFDHFGALLDNALQSNRTTTGYPRYNIEALEDNEYSISLEVPGFDESELDIQVEKNILTVSGKASSSDDRQYIYRGITNKAFEQKFNLAEFVEVKGAKLHNGLLIISLYKNLPDSMKPRRIEINGGSAKTLEHKPAKDKAA